MSSVLDTNVLVFDTFEDSQLHKVATSKLDTLDRWYIPSIVFHEYVWFMKAEDMELGFGKNKLLEYLTNAKTTYCPVEPVDILFASREMADYREYNDLLVLSVSRRMDQPLLTYDKPLQKACERFNVKTVESGAV
jgi:hypothetical protein